jgi:hypothetical protein
VFCGEADGILVLVVLDAGDSAVVLASVQDTKSATIKFASNKEVIFLFMEEIPQCTQ